MVVLGLEMAASCGMKSAISAGLGQVTRMTSGEIPYGSRA